MRGLAALPPRVADWLTELPAGGRLPTAGGRGSAVAVRPRNPATSAVAPAGPLPGRATASCFRPRAASWRYFLADSTAWPPNSLRSAAIIFIDGESSWREENRAKSEAVIAGSGTAWSMAASTVQRPSPESWA